jgi:hypothetical protein
MDIQIRFTFDTEFGPFSDALYLPEDHTLTDAEVESLKQERLTNWLSIITAPAVEDTPPAILGA